MIDQMTHKHTLTADELWDIAGRIPTARPIVHCITNIVSVNDCANLLLAVGASPTMAHHPMEAAEISSGASALVCNFGAIGDYDAMTAAGHAAHELRHPIIVDPVGVSGSSYRRGLCLDFIQTIHPDCVRGNYSEIRALMENRPTAAGVDAPPDEAAQGDRLLEDMLIFSKKWNLILIASGATDYVTGGDAYYEIRNGHPDMTRITGSGCMSSALLGAFLSVERSLRSAAASCAWMGIAGELAAERTAAAGGGTMTFREKLIDALSLMGRTEAVTRLRA